MKFPLAFMLCAALILTVDAQAAPKVAARAAAPVAGPSRLTGAPPIP